MGNKKVKNFVNKNTAYFQTREKQAKNANYIQTQKKQTKFESKKIPDKSEYYHLYNENAVIYRQDIDELLFSFRNLNYLQHPQNIAIVAPNSIRLPKINLRHLLSSMRISSPGNIKWLVTLLIFLSLIQSVLAQQTTLTDSFTGELNLRLQQALSDANLTNVINDLINIAATVSANSIPLPDNISQDSLFNFLKDCHEKDFEKFITLWEKSYEYHKIVTYKDFSSYDERYFNKTTKSILGHYLHKHYEQNLEEAVAKQDENEIITLQKFRDNCKKNSILPTMHWSEVVLSELPNPPDIILNKIARNDHEAMQWFLSHMQTASETEISVYNAKLKNRSTSYRIEENLQKEYHKLLDIAVAEQDVDQIKKLQQSRRSCEKSGLIAHKLWYAVDPAELPYPSDIVLDKIIYKQDQTVINWFLSYIKTASEADTKHYINKIRNWGKEFAFFRVTDFYSTLVDAVNASDISTLQKLINFINETTAGKYTIAGNLPLPIIPEILEDQVQFIALKNKDIASLTLLLDTWPQLNSFALITSAMLKNDEAMLEFLLQRGNIDINGGFYLRFNDKNQIAFQLGAFNNEMTTLLTFCAENNLITSAKLLIKYGAWPDIKLGNNYQTTPLAKALTKKHFDFAWMIVDVYKEKGYELREEQAYELLDFVAESYDRLKSGKISDAASLLFFRAQNASESAIVATTFVALTTAAIIIVTCYFQTQKTEKEAEEFMRDVPRRLKLIIPSSDLSEYIKKFGGIFTMASPYVDAATGNVLFPTAIILQDGRSFEWNAIIFKNLYDRRISYTSSDPIKFSECRLNINLLASFKDQLITQINNDQSLTNSKRGKLLKEINEIPYLKVNRKSNSSIPWYFLDPNTNKIMDNPYVAPNGISYNLDKKYKGNNVTLVNIPIFGFGSSAGFGRVKFFRNYALRDRIEEYKKSEEYTNLLSTNSSYETLVKK